MTTTTLASLTTLAVGGPLASFVQPASRDELDLVLARLRHSGEKLLPIGGGSNMLCADDGFLGVGVQYLASNIAVVSEDADHVLVRVEAGCVWDTLVAYAVGNQWAGIECMSGIPGHVGAAPIQNIGAYGQELADVLVDLEAIDLSDGAHVVFDKAACAFGYRASRFKHADRGRYFVTALTLRLRLDGLPTLKYRDLTRALPDGGTLSQTREVVLAVRASKSMVYDPSDENHRSAGSFFTNPVVSVEHLQVVRDRVRAVQGPNVKVPEYLADGGVKLSAAWLMDHADRGKGFRLGRARLSTQHCLALVNPGDATAADLLALARDIRQRVYFLYDVLLEPEPAMVGFEEYPLPAP